MRKELFSPTENTALELPETVANPAFSSVTNLHHYSTTSSLGTVLHLGESRDLAVYHFHTKIWKVASQFLCWWLQEPTQKSSSNTTKTRCQDGLT